MASSGSDGELIRVDKRPEPVPPALLRLLGVRGSFNEPGHGLLSFQSGVFTVIDAARTRRFAECSKLFRIPLAGVLVGGRCRVEGVPQLDRATSAQVTTPDSRLAPYGCIVKCRPAAYCGENGMSAGGNTDLKGG